MWNWQKKFCTTYLGCCRKHKIVSHCLRRKKKKKKRSSLGGSHLCSGTLPLKLKCTYSGLGQAELEGSYCLLNLELATFNKTSKKQHFNLTWFFICCNYSSLQLACHVILYLDYISNSSFGILRAFIAWFRIK